jgi:hypothetical protein
MANLPYVSSPGTIDRALAGIKNAAVPPKVSQDFVKTILKIPGGSGDQMTAYLKKIGFSSSSGDPTELYRKFRNTTSSAAAVATAIRTAYAPLYVRNEFMHELTDEQLQGLIVEETGQPEEATVVRLTLSCIKHLKSFAKFDAEQEKDVVVSDTPIQMPPTVPPLHESHERRERGFGLNLGYTINLNLPATADPEVFDAIFSSLKKHLLRSDDA